MAKKLSKQISLGIDPLTGKRIRKWIHADTQTGLKQAEKDAIAQFAREGNPSNITYEKYEKKWLAAYVSHVVPHTYAGYMSLLKRNEVFHGKKMRDITKTDIQKIISDNSDKPSVCKQYSRLVNRIWESAVADGICQKNVAHNLTLPKCVRISRRALTEEELAGIKKADLDTSERFLMDVLLQFGLRPGEAYALDKKSFNRKDRTLIINKAVSYDHNMPFIKSTKTGVTRVLPVPDSFWSKIPDSKTMYYFVEEDGQLMRRHKSNKFSREILKKINIAMGGTDKLKVTDMTLYNCRHNKATLLYYLPGVSLKKKAEYMGHSERMFLQIYSHIMEEKEDMEALREAINL